MKRLINFLILWFVPFILSAQDNCPHYNKYIQRGNAELNKGSKADFRKAINDYSTAMLHCPEKAEEGRAKILEAYQKIEALKIEAEYQRDLSTKASIESIKKTQSAIANELGIKSQLLLNKNKRNEALGLALFGYKYVDSTNKYIHQILFDAFHFKELSHKQIEPFVNCFMDMTSPVKQANYSSNGKLIGIISVKGRCSVWNTEKCEEIQSFNISEEEYYSMKFFNNGDNIVTAGDSIRIWDVKTGEMIRCLHLKTDISFPNTAYDVDVSPDETLIASTSGKYDESRVVVWDITTGEVKYVLDEGYRRTIRAIDFSTDGNSIVIGDGKGGHYIWDYLTGKKLKFQVQKEGIISKKFSPDGKTIISIDTDNKIKLWDAITGKELKRYKGQSKAVNSVDFSPDGNLIITRSLDSTIIIWDIAYSKPIKKFKMNSAINSVRFSPSGKFILSGNMNNSASSFEWNLKNQNRKFSGHTGDILSANFSSDGGKMISGGGYDDHKAIVWDLMTGEQINVFKGKHYYHFFNSVGFSPNGNYAITADHGGMAKIWDLKTGKEAASLKRHSSWISDASFSSDSRYVVTSGGGADTFAKIWDFKTEKELHTLVGHSDGLTSACFSQDGNYVLTGSYDNSARLWDAKTGEVKKVFYGHNESVESIAFSSDSKLIATASRDNSIKIWSLESGKELRTIFNLDYEAWIGTVSFSQSGDSILTGDSNGFIKIWETQSGKLLKSFKASNSAISVAKFSPDMKYILSSEDKGALRLWEIETNEIIKKIPNHHLLITNDIVDNNLYEIIIQLNKWDFFLNKSHVNELNSFGKYLSQRAKTVSDEEEKLKLFSKIIQCYTSAIKKSDNNFYKKKIGEIYFEWSLINYKNKEYDKAFEKAELSFNFFENDRILSLLNMIAFKKNAISHFSFQRINSLNQREKDKIIELIMEYEGWELAEELVEKIQYQEPSLKNNMRLYVISFEQKKKLNQWLDTNDVVFIDKVKDFLWNNYPYPRRVEYILPFLRRKNALKPSLEISTEIYYSIKKSGKNFDINEFPPPPKDIEESFKYVHLLIRHGDYDKAIEYLEKIQEIQDLPIVRFTMDFIYSHIGEDKFEELFFSSNLENVKSDISYFTPSVDETNKEKLKAYKKVFRLSEYLLKKEDTPENRKLVVSNFNNYGWYQLISGDFSGAEKIIKRGLELDSSDMYLNTNLAPAYLLQGKYKQAIQEYKKWSEEKYPKEIIDMETYEKKTVNFADIFLKDIEAFEKEKIIPLTHRLIVNKIRDCLQSEEMRICLDDIKFED